MNNPMIPKSLILFILILLTIQCKKDDQKTDETIPLDGRGGGIIAYCLQPPTESGIHKLFAMNADGTGNKQLVTASIGLNHQDWSPDGNKLAAVGYINHIYTWSIFTFNANGTGITRLTSVSNVWDAEPDWSPDGTQIAFTRIYPSNNDKRELWIMNANGTNQHFIGIEGFGSEWSADGTKFIYTSNKSGNSEIYTCNIDGTNEQRLTNTSTQELFAEWSHDGSKIVFSSYTGEISAISTYEIFTMNADGTNLVKLTENNNFDYYPRWSPDDSKITFESDRATPNRYEVFIMNADGSSVTRLTNTSDSYSTTFPAWKPI